MRRSQVIDAVIEILSKEGWEGLTVRRISEVARMSNGAMVHFVGNKDEMIGAATRRHYERYLERTETALSDGSPYERLRTLVTDIIASGTANYDEWACWLALWGRAPFDPTMRTELRRVYSRHSARLADIVREGVAAGQFRSTTDPRIMADQVVALIDGLAMRRVMDPKAHSPQRVQRMVMDYIDQQLVNDSKEVS